MFSKCEPFNGKFRKFCGKIKENGNFRSEIFENLVYFVRLSFFPGISGICLGFGFTTSGLRSVE